MFGFLVPRKPDPIWRRSYARVCQYQNRRFGITSLAFLSYEATFLYQLAIDTGVAQALPESAPTCCRLRKISRAAMKNADAQEESTPAILAAAFGLVLAGVKLQDDVTDSGRWPQQLLWWIYRRQVRRAENLLEESLPGTLFHLQDCIQRHHDLEKLSSCSLHETMKPTGDGFAVVFRKAAEFLMLNNGKPSSTDTADRFEHIGRLVGEAIIAWDCAVDFEADKIRGHFNPLQNAQEREQAFHLCRLRLAQIGWLCPQHSTSGQLIRSVMDRIEIRLMNAPSACSPTRLERWGLLRQKGYSYARCDGCEVLCCFGEAADCCVTSSTVAQAPCCYESAWCCTSDPCGSKNSTTPVKTVTRTRTANSKTKLEGRTQQSRDGEGDESAPESLDYSRFIDCVGTTFGALTPVGFVLIDGQQLPARNQTGRYIEANISVRVVSADQYGVTVRRE